MAEQTDSPDRTREFPEPEAGAEAPAVSQEQGSQAVAEGAQEEVATPTEHAEAVDAATEEPAGEAPLADTGGTSPAEADAAATDEGFAERPEVLVAGAFAGGLLLAIVLRSVGRG